MAGQAGAFLLRAHAVHELADMAGQGVEQRLRGRVGLPWKRRLSKAALVIPRIRYFESKYMSYNDEDLRKESMRLRGLARGGDEDRDGS